MSEIKTVRLCGTAASELSGKKTRRKRKQDGGSNSATNAGSTNSHTWLKYPEGPVPPNPVPSTGGGKADTKPDTKPDTRADTKPDTKADTKPDTKPDTNSDTKQIRVELKHKKKIHLNPKKAEVQKQKKTKKVRKVTIGVSVLHRRITRAKKLHKKIKELPLDKLKEKLIKEGLIKSTSKAPESVLRQIAHDSEAVSKRVH